MEDWQIEALEEVRREALQNNPLLLAGVTYVEFVSNSNGRNKPKRKRWREVRLVSFNGKTVSIGNKLTRKVEFLMQDVFPEILTLDSKDDWLTTFINALREAMHLSK